MSRQNKTIAIVSTVIALISLLIAAANLKINIDNNSKPPQLVPEKSRFSCQQQLDSKRGGSLWTVMYHPPGKNARPWLNMVKEFGDGWNTEKRCNEIAQRLEIFRQDGLIQLSYLDSHPNTPKQGAICAKTRLSGEKCPLLVTLAPGVDPYIALSKITQALRKGYSVDQSDGSGLLSDFSRTSPVINLQPFLAEDDL